MRWRNVLRISEIPWVRDHEVETQAVFPAAGYLAMAMEAMRQISSFEAKPTSHKVFFEFRDVDFTAALLLSTKDGHDVEDVELHMTMSPRTTQSKMDSDALFDFTISSWTAGRISVHCVGTVFLVQGQLDNGSTHIEPTIDYRTWTMGKWYEKATEGGFKFGSFFQSIKSLWASISQADAGAICTVQPKSLVRGYSPIFYPAHPITIDACLQALSFSAASGNVRKYRAYLPVSISRARIQYPTDHDKGDEVHIHVKPRKTGSSNLRANFSARTPEGSTVMDWTNVRLLTFDNMSLAGSDIKTPRYPQCHPVLRVKWKPDISRLSPGTEKRISDYVTSCEGISTSHHDEVESAFQSLIDLVGHQNPEMHVLEIASSKSADLSCWTNLLGRDMEFPRCRTWHVAPLDEIGRLRLEDTGVSVFDLLVYAVWKLLIIKNHDHETNDR
jgi:hypothetical protein